MRLYLYAMKRTPIVLLLLCAIAQSLVAQNQSAWHVQASGGFLAPHHRSMQYLVSEHVYQLQAGFRLGFSGNNSWLKHWRSPDILLTANYADLGNRATMGEAFSLLVSANIPIVKQKNSALYYTLGTGPSWLTRPFDAENNYYQIAIASHLNAHVRLALGYAYGFAADARSKFHLLLSFDHFSNGCFKEPNLGLNLISLGSAVSVGYGRPITVNDASVNSKKNTRYTAIYVTGGVKQYAAYDTEFYYIGSVYTNHNYFVSEHRALGAGVDFIHDKSIEHYYRDGFGIENTRTFRMGFHVNQDLYFNKLVLTVQLGVYVINPKKDDGLIYDRIGLKYQFNKHFIAGLMLKSHISVADCFELTLGYRF